MCSRVLLLSVSGRKKNEFERNVLEMTSKHAPFIKETPGTRKNTGTLQ